ncbi:hypothetical protein T4D_4605 [Trichinella pseudospiralis]|uniref:Uncharacterized protein n=1 Tax=Trichinella pseudospiralis TaxID=6337 RepID=A0A0V1FX20_TRIPS|nr:hypothetical protein T4D_4605 [Trichinella pseudospiralis]
MNYPSGDESGGTRLQVIQTLVHGDGGAKIVVNFLFDSAAERSFIREDVAHQRSRLPIAAHVVRSVCREAQKSWLVNLWLCPLIAEAEER